MASMKISLGVKEMKNYKPLLQQLFAEGLGTFLFVSIALLVDQEAQYSAISVGLSNGLLLGTIVQIIGNVSGGHINPAVTLAVLVCGEIKPLRALCYIAAQLVGGIIGSAVSYAILDTYLQESFGGIVQHGRTAIFALELLLTFVLVAVFLSVTDSSRGARGLGSAALAVGLSITACECSCTFYSVGINPVRMLSPAVVAACMERAHATSGDWSRIWIYCISPLAGGLVAGLVYRFVLNLKVSNSYEEPLTSSA